MATRSTIAIKNEDNTITSIYCHWDGYLKNNGVLLKEHYNTEEKVRELLALGGLSSLAPNINPTEAHSFEHPQDGVCVAYHRDRKEDLNIETFQSVEDWQKNGEQFNYLFDGGVWKYCEDNTESTLQIF